MALALEALLLLGLELELLLALALPLLLRAGAADFPGLRLAQGEPV